MKKLTKAIILSIYILVLTSRSLFAGEISISTNTATVSVSTDSTYSGAETPNITISSNSSILQKVVDFVGGEKNDAKIKVTNPKGEVVIDQRIPDKNSTVMLKASNLNPGEYKVKVNNKDVTTFAWGVLTINTDKDIYMENDVAYLQMASLDKDGHTLCNSNLELKVVSPEGKVDSTTPSKSGECGDDNVTDIPDYFAKYQISGQGIYDLILKNLDNNFEIESKFEVKNGIPFSIQRVGATRINPFKADYKMTIKIKAFKDFNGIVKDTLPNDFELVDSINSWESEIKQGEEKIYSYVYRAPKVTPEIFLIGPLVIGEYKEGRVWQLASDGSSQVQDSTNTSATRSSSTRRTVRTTIGRVFALSYNGTDNLLVYSDNTEQTTPTWNNVGAGTFGTGFSQAELVWDETNNVIYMAYGRLSASNNSNSDIYYMRVTDLDTTPALGAERIALDGTAGAITYNLPHVEISQDSGTTKVFVFGTRQNQASSTSSVGWDVAVGTINSDNPTFGTFNVKTWTAAAVSGLMGVTPVNADRFVVYYYDGTELRAARHDNASDAEASSGWDALDGTDTTFTTITTDDPTAIGEASVVGMPTTNGVWFSWQDASNDINTIFWNGTGLDTEMALTTPNSDTATGALATDGVTLWLVYRQTNLVFQSRSATDGTTAWSGTETTLDTNAETIGYPVVSKRPYQVFLDILYTTQTSAFVRHVSYATASNFYFKGVDLKGLNLN